MMKPVPSLAGFFKKSDWSGWGAVLLFGIFVVSTALKLKGGFSTTETYSYIPLHLEGHPWYWHAFSPKIFDDNLSRGRFLSFLTDFADVRFIAFSTGLGLPHFLSVFHYFCLAVIAGVGWRFMRNDLRLSGRLSTLALGCLLFAPGSFLTASYFRTGKTGATLIAFLLSTQAFRWIRAALSQSKFKISHGQGLGLCLLGCLGFPMDEIGGFFVFFWAMMLAVFAFRLRSRGLARGATWLGMSFGTSLILKIWGYPLFCRRVQGSSPVSWNVPFREYLPDLPTFSFDVIGLLSDQIGYVFGNLPTALGGVVGILMLIFATIELNKRMPPGSRPEFGVAIISAASLLIFACLLVMKLRHPAITADDLRRMYYFFPFQVFVWWGALLCLSGWTHSWAHSKTLRELGTSALLAALLLSNVFSLSHHVRTYRLGHMATAIERSPRILAGLRNLPNGSSADMSSEIWENPAYQALRNYFNRVNP